MSYYLQTKSAGASADPDGVACLGVVPVSIDAAGNITTTGGGMLPNGASLVASLTTLFDGKVLHADDSDFWQNVGTGTAAFADSKVTLSVTAGQYEIRQSRRPMQYFSGKVQLVEITFDQFHTEAGVTKRFGYFSSSAVAPYSANLDGFFVENASGVITLQSWRNGTKTAEAAVSTTADLSKFTVAQFYFLWLGGAACDFYLASPGQGFQKVAGLVHAGTNDDVISLYPNQPVRYEIRSTGGAGSFRSICSQVATAGSISESGKALSVVNIPALACDVVGTRYVLLAIRKRADRRHISVKLNSMGAVNAATDDAGVLQLIKGGTPSLAITFANLEAISWGAAGSGTTHTGGVALFSTPVSAAGASTEFAEDYMTWLTSQIDDTMDVFYLTYTPLTINQNVAGTVNLKAYI